MLTRTKVFSLTIATLLVLTLAPGAPTTAAPLSHQLATALLPMEKEPLQIRPIARGPADGYWTQRTSMTTARDHPGMIGANGKIYVFGGSNASGALDSVEIYDMAADNWTFGPSMPGAKSAPSVVSVGGLIYVLGGNEIVYCFDPSQGTWSTKTPVPASFSGAAAVAVFDGKIYLTCNEQWMYCYNPAADSWTEKTPVPVVRSIASFAVLNGKLYAIGGGEPGHSPSEINRIDVYDPASDSWTIAGAASMGTRRTHLGSPMPVVNGKIYVISGWNGYSAQTSVEEYDPTTNSWRYVASMPTARYAIGYGVLGNKIYAIGGNYGGAGGHWQTRNDEFVLDSGGTWNLMVSATSNSVAIADGANIQLDHGTYEVSVSSNLNLASGISVYDVNKVVLWTDTVGYPDDWFWVVQEGVTQTITFSHLYPGTATIWAFLPDTGTGDNVGSATVTFTPAYSISGRVTDDDINPIPNVTISDDAGHTITTNDSGYYTITGLITGTYTLTPTESGWTFTPPTRTVSVPPSATGQDFTGSSSEPAPSGSLTLLVASSIPSSYPLTAMAQVRNTGTAPQEFTLILRLRQDSTILSTQTFTLSLASGAIADRTVDFGLRPTRRYRVEATLSAGGTTLATQSRDVTVADPNASRIILDYAGGLKAAAHAELYDIADLPAQAMGDTIVSLGLTAIDNYAAGKFADFAAPIQDAGDIPHSTSNDAIAQIQDKLRRIEGDRQAIAKGVSKTVRNTCGLVLSEDFDPLNPDWASVLPNFQDCVKVAISGWLGPHIRDSIIGPLWVNGPRSDVDGRHVMFEDFVLSHPVAEEPPGLAGQIQHGRDHILNVVEGDAIVTLGPYDVLGHTLRYDLTLQEQENKRQQIDHAGTILKIALAVLVVVGVVIILLLIVGAISSAGTLAAVVGPIIWKIVKVLLTVSKILKVATALLAVSMLFTVPVIAPHVPQYQDETLDAAETLIGSSGMARLRSFDVAIQPAQARLTAQVVGPETGQSQVLVETALYSVDGRIINIVWSPLQIQAGQQAMLSKDVPLAPGTYRAVTTLYAEGDVAAAEAVPFDVPGPGVEMALNLDQPCLSLGEPVQARVTLTNTSPISDVNDLTLIVESTDGVNFDAWPVSLAASATQQIDYTFTPTATGACVLRAWLGIGLNTLAQQDAAYIVGSGPAVALNTSVSDVYTPGLTVTLPLTLTNVGDAPGAVTVTVQTVDRLQTGVVVFSSTLTATVPAGGMAFAEATALPNAQPGLYAAWLEMNGAAYDSFDFAVSAEDTLFGLLTVGGLYPAVGQSVPVTATVRSADDMPTDATITTTVQSPTGTLTILPMIWVSSGTYRADYTLAISGTYSLELAVTRTDYRGVGDQSFLVAGTPTLLIPTVEGQPKAGEIRPLTVTVHSEAGIPVPGVTVVLSGTEEILRGETDAAGSVVLQTFPPDGHSYVLTTDKMGYAGAITEVSVEWFRLYLPLILRNP